jgi:hypothetical protein
VDEKTNDAVIVDPAYVTEQVPPLLAGDPVF